MTNRLITSIVKKMVDMKATPQNSSWATPIKALIDSAKNFAGEEAKDHEAALQEIETLTKKIMGIVASPGEGFLLIADALRSQLPRTEQQPPFDVSVTENNVLFVTEDTIARSAQQHRIKATPTITGIKEKVQIVIVSIGIEKGLVACAKKVTSLSPQGKNKKPIYALKVTKTK